MFVKVHISVQIATLVFISLSNLILNINKKSTRDKLPKSNMTDGNYSKFFNKRCSLNNNSNRIVEIFVKIHSE